jgi:hypothetical protein
LLELRVQLLDQRGSRNNVGGHSASRLLGFDTRRPVRIENVR